MLQRERQHGLAVGAEHEVLCHDRLAKPDLASVHRLVVGGPRRVAELHQQVLGDIVQRRRAVEVHEDRPDLHVARGILTPPACTSCTRGSRTK